MKVVINEAHSLLPEQDNLIKNEAKRQNEADIELVKVPAAGWTKAEQDEMVEKLRGNFIVFVSPVPYLLMRLAYIMGGETKTIVTVMHNDNRNKKELSNGKVVFTIPQNGWQLLYAVN